MRFHCVSKFEPKCWRRGLLQCAYCEWADEQRRANAASVAVKIVCASVLFALVVAACVVAFSVGKAV